MTTTLAPPSTTAAPGSVGGLPWSAKALIVVLVADAGCHLIWATGLTWPFASTGALSDAVLGMTLSFAPNVLLPLALILLTAAGAVLLQARLGGHRPGARRRRGLVGRLARLVTLGLTVGLLTRAALGLVWVVAPDGMLRQPFGWLNALVYTPICLALGGCGLHLLGSGRARRWGVLRGIALTVPALLVAVILLAAYAWPVPQLSASAASGQVASSESAALASSGAVSRYVDTPVARLHYLRAGTGTPVVLLAPGASPAIAWLPQLRALATRHTVYVLELPGQGASTALDPGFRYDLDAMTGVIGGFLDAMDLPVTALAGNSWSGGWALAFAQRHPERVSSLVLLDSSGLDRADPLTWEVLKLPVLGRALTRISVASRGATESGLRAMFGHPDRLAPALVDDFWAAARRPENIRATYLLEARLDWSVTDDALATTTTPTLILWGGADGVLPVAQADEFERRMPDAEVRTFAGCGHAITLDCPDQVNSAMADFLRAP